AYHRMAAQWLRRVLHETHDLAVTQFGDTEHLRVWHAREQNLRGWRIAGEVLDELRDAFVEQVVAEIHHERIAADEALADLHRVRQASRSVLLDVHDPYTPRRSVAN